MIRGKVTRRLSFAIGLTLLQLGRVGAAADANSLLVAVEAGSVETVERLLAKDPNTEVRDERGWTPLIIAANAGNARIAQLLVEKGADANAKSTSTNGNTVLCFATQSDNPDFLNLLLQHNAQINARSRNGMTALYTAVMLKKERAVKFLISKGANLDQLAFINERGCLFTPLMNTVCDGNVRFAELLLKNGASLEKRNNLGNTALMEAAMRPYPDMVKLLIEHGANVNTKAPRGHTALIYAAKYGQTENIKVLLAAGADPNATARLTNNLDESGDDAVRFANFQGDAEGASLILDAQKRAQSTRGL